MPLGGVFDSPNLTASSFVLLASGANAERQLRIGNNITSAVGAIGSVLVAMQTWSNVYGHIFSDPALAPWNAPAVTQVVSAAQTSLQGYLKAVNTKRDALNTLVNTARDVVNSA